MLSSCPGVKIKTIGKLNSGEDIELNMENSDDEVEIKVNLDLDDRYRAFNKLALVVHDLAVGKGKITDRLYEVGPEILSLNEKNFPEDLRSDFRWIRKMLTDKPAKMITIPQGGKMVQKSTGTLGATLRFMRHDKASIIAERIFLLYEEVGANLSQSQGRPESQTQTKNAKVQT